MPTVSSETPDASIAYRQRLDDLIAALGTDERQGLTEEQARSRLERYGRNELAAEKAVPAWRKFLAQFQDVLVILLLAATAISAGLWLFERDAALPYEAIAIFVVVLLNAAMGYIQESRAEAGRIGVPGSAPIRRASSASATMRFDCAWMLSIR